MILCSASATVLFNAHIRCFVRQTFPKLAAFDGFRYEDHHSAEAQRLDVTLPRRLPMAILRSALSGEGLPVQRTRGDVFEADGP